MAEKSEVVANNLDFIIEKINRLKKNDYETVTESDRRMVKEILENSSLENKIKLLGAMQELSPEEVSLNQKIEADNNFLLPQHLRKKYQELSGIDKDLFSRLQSEDVSYKASASKLYNNLKYIDKVPPEYERLAGSVLSALVSARGKPNRELASLLEDKKVSFRFFESGALDGKCDYKPSDKNGEKSVVISLSSGCFSDENIEALPMLMSHELGHYIDISRRPPGYQGHMEGEEFFADKIGYSMALNAGFDCKRFIGYTRSLGKKISAKNNNESNILLERAQDLHKYDSRQQLNAVAIAKLSASRR